MASNTENVSIWWRHHARSPHNKSTMSVWFQIAHSAAIAILFVITISILSQIMEPMQHLGYLPPITVYPKKYAHGFCFAVLCCGYTLTDFPISIRLTSLWQSNDCPSASKATLMNMDKYFMWIHYGRLHNHNKAKHNKTVCIFLGIYCTSLMYCFGVLSKFNS